MILPLVLTLLSAASLAAMHRLGVFRPEGVLGPRRWEGRPVLLYFGVLLTSAMVWLMTTGFTLGLLAGKAPLQEKPRELLAATIFGAAVGAGVAGLLRMLLLPRPPTPHHSPAGQVRAGLLTLVLIWPVVMLVGTLTLWLLELAGKSIPTEHEFLKLLTDPNRPPGLTPLVIVSAALGAPVVEELIFRGLLQTTAVALFDKTARDTPSAISARWAGILVTSLLFAVTHPAFSWTSIAVLSIALGYLYERTGRLLPCIICHMGFNSISLVLALTGVSKL